MAFTIEDGQMNDKAALTVDEFCARQNFSRATYYLLQKQGRGPRSYKVGRKTLISTEAAEEWQRKMEGGEQAANG